MHICAQVIPWPEKIVVNKDSHLLRLRIDSRSEMTLLKRKFLGKICDAKYLKIQPSISYICIWIRGIDVKLHVHRPSNTKLKLTNNEPSSQKPPSD